jgi:Protein of unknown function (DUF4238)
MIGSHIIPKFYLEQFSTPARQKGKPGRIWVYEKGKQPHQRSTSVQGAENGYFGYIRDDGSVDGVLEEAFEKELARRESECATVLFCSKSHLYHWPHGSREKLAFYAALLFSRATQRREHSAKNSRYTVEMFERAINEDKTLRDDLIACFKQRFNQDFTEQEIRDLLLKPVLQSRGLDAEKNQFLTDLIENAESVARFILDKPIWEVWQPPEGLEFVTSDNPLVSAVHLPHGKFHPGYGFGKREIIALFPLAPTACLAAGTFSSGTTGVVGYRSVEASAVAEVNEAVVSISDRYVYSKTRSDELQKTVDLYGASFRYGVNALMPVGIKLPSVAEASAALRAACGLSRAPQGLHMP